MKRRCPICKKVIKASAEKQSEEAKFLPFCSQRCKLIDLGDWLDGKYKIVSKLPDAPPDTPAKR
jgi:endogenous inhibitor of DNA gyrase (YacG/DUF329 family)